jgi:hypothetical protein
MKQQKSKSTAKKRARKAPSGSARKKSTGQSTSVGQTFNWISDSLSSPIVRQAVAAALVAGAAAAAAVFTGKGRMKSGGRSLASMLSGATKDMTEAAVHALAGAATNEAKELLPSEPNEPDRSSRQRGSGS